MVVGIKKIEIEITDLLSDGLVNLCMAYRQWLHNQLTLILKFHQVKQQVPKVSDLGLTPHSLECCGIAQNN